MLQQQRSPVLVSAPSSSHTTSTLLPRPLPASSVSGRRKLRVRPLSHPSATPAQQPPIINGGSSSYANPLNNHAGSNAPPSSSSAASSAAQTNGSTPLANGSSSSTDHTRPPAATTPVPLLPRRSSSLSTRSTSNQANNNTASSSPITSTSIAPPTSPSAAALALSPAQSAGPDTDPIATASVGTGANSRGRPSSLQSLPGGHRGHSGHRSKAKARSILKDHRSPPHPPSSAAPMSSMGMGTMGPPAMPLMAALLGQDISGGAGTGSTHARHNGHTRSASKGSSTLGPIRASPTPLDDATADLREALAYCSDPSISWSLQFWVTIADPLTNDVFFACPATGQCSWEPPVGAFVIPRSPEGEWWELADASRDNQSYYYNTLTGVTQWQRPDNGAFVIPLGLIQRNALPSPRSSSSSPEKRSTAENGTANSLTSGSVRFAANSPAPALRPSGNDVPLPPQAGSATASSSGPLTPIADMSPASERVSTSEQQSWWDRRKARSRLLSSPSKSNLKSRSPGTSPVLPHENGNGASLSPNGSPLPDDGTLPSHMNPSAVNLVLQPSSPMAATYQLETFSTDNFADRYFATKRSGVLRQRMSLERIMEWQRSPITAPLLVLTKASVQDAVTTFKVIQHVMGDRERPVDGVRSPNHLPNPSMLSLRSTRDEAQGRDEKMVILEEIRWMIQLGVGRVEMRDELFCQLIKQLTRNPEEDATVLGFQLFCVLVHAFGPSKSFEPFVRSFLIGNVERTEYGIGLMSKFCLTRLDTWMQKGGRGRVLTIAEIEHASDAAFYPSVYAQTLETIMQRQEGAYPQLRIPIILPFLADGILALGGTEAEGIFRVPGDQDVITHLKARIDHGQYQLSGIDDPHVVASLFKLWLRELEEPVVPTNLYDAALAASKDPDLTILFLKKLPDHNRRVLLFVVSFMQLFLDPEVVEITKMPARNLSLVLAPNILRTPDDSLSTVFANSSFECQFVVNLLEHLDPPTVDPEYVPVHGSTARGSFDSSVDVHA